LNFSRLHSNAHEEVPPSQESPLINIFNIQLALAYGSRSSIFFEQGKYEFTVKDIDAALLHGYNQPAVPQNKASSKLITRKSDCLLKLGYAEEAKRELESIPQLYRNSKWIEHYTCASNDQTLVPHALKLKLLKSFHAFQIELLNRNYNFTSHPKMFCLNTKVELYYDHSLTRFCLKAKKDLECGEVISMTLSLFDRVVSRV